MRQAVRPENVDFMKELLMSNNNLDDSDDEDDPDKMFGAS